MSTHLVQAAVSRSNRNRLLLSSVVALMVFALIALQWRYLVSFWYGPTPIAAADIAKLTAADQLTRPWVDVSGEDVFDTGVQYVTETDSGAERVDARYLALVVDERLLVVKTSAAGLATQYSGALVDLPSAEQREIVDAFDQEYPDYKGAFLPLMLDAGNFRTEGYIWYTIAAALVVACGWGGVTALRRMADPLKHPVFKHLAAYGQPLAVASEIEHELQATQATLDKVTVTPSWLVSRKRGFDAARLQDIVWIYRHVTKTKYYGVVTVNTTHAIHLWDRYSQKIEVQLKAKQVDELLELVARHAPWAIVGYSAELQRAWNKQRPDVIAAVDERRQQSDAGSANLYPRLA